MSACRPRNSANPKTECRTARGSDPVPARTRAGASFLDSHVWRPELGMRVLVVDKADLARTRWHELPAGFLFHLGNAWEDDQGTIRFDCALAPDDSTLRAFGSLMSGDYRPGTDSVASLVTLPRQGPGRIERTGLQTEFPRIDARRVGLRHRTVYSVMRSPARTGFGFDRVIALDLEGGRLDSYDYGPDMLVEEHLFVPDPARRGERGGWLLGTALDVRARATRLSIFDAGSLASGPVAQATLGRPLPLGFHGVFTAA